MNAPAFKSTSLVVAIVAIAAACGTLAVVLNVWQAKHNARLKAKREYQIRYLEELVHDPSLADCAWRLAGFKKALDLLKKGEVTPTPTITCATLFKRRDSEHWSLYIEYVEEDIDTAGIIIQEVNEASGLDVSERYPIFADLDPDWRSKYFTNLWKPPPEIPVTLRTGLREKKDIEAWERWASNPSSDTFPPAPIWITLPEAGGWHVQVAIYDKAGNVSEAVPVHYDEQVDRDDMAEFRSSGDGSK